VVLRFPDRREGTFPVQLVVSFRDVPRLEITQSA